MRQSLARLIVSAWRTLLHLASKIWDVWGIQLLVVASFFFQVILVYFGGRRRYYYKKPSRFFIWASYLLASTIPTIALGKLTVIPILTPENPLYDVELQALLAPLLLMHLSNPDCISAYSIEDTHMGLRNVLKLLVDGVLVIWIIIRCFDKSSPISMILYIPLLIAGIIEPLATILTLLWVHDDTISASELKEREKNRSPKMWERVKDAPACLFHVLMAYYRFDILRPHRVNWTYHLASVEDTWMSVDALETLEDAFHVTEIELGFVYDAVYTQSPMVCTKKGLWSRAISISCLVFALLGFSIIYRNAFLLDPYVTYTYAILIGSTIMELYQIFTLPFSYTAVIALWKWSQNRGESCKSKCYKILEILNRVCKSQKQWSNKMGQLNLVEYCFKDVSIPKPGSFILSKVHTEAEAEIKKCWRLYYATKHVTIDSCLKVKIIEKLRNMGQEGGNKGKTTAFDEKKFWTLHDFQIGTDGTKQERLYWGRELDKCIIIWHVATDILLLHLDETSKNNRCCWPKPSPTSKNSCCCGTKPSPSSLPCLQRVSKLLSNYMMYLLTDHPYLLSLTTGDVTIGYASSILQALAKQIHGCRCSCTFKEKYRQQLLNAIMKGKAPENQTEDYKTIITEDWNVLGDVNMLVTHLENLDDKWMVVSGAWIEMLCYAAQNPHVYGHTKMLGKGGELITHVWLLLRHKTVEIPHQEEAPK